MAGKRRVLFICVHNSARSQMAEALFNRRCHEPFQALSAGLEPGTLNPLAVEVLKEWNLDITDKSTQSVFDVFKSGQLFAYVISVCDEASTELCPIFPGITKRLHWSFPDPSSFTGTWGEQLEQTRQVRDAIAMRIEEWCEAVCPEEPQDVLSSS